MRRIREKLVSMLRTQAKPVHALMASNVITSDFLHVALPLDIPDLPGMITQSEGNYLYWLASEVYRGDGAIVEVGTWLGRSTVHLAAGLRAKHPGKKLTCYDHYVWASGANWSQIGPKKEAGSDFMGDFRGNVANYSDIIVPFKSKIATLTLPDEPIEVIVLDAPKRINDISAILSKLCGRAIPGKTVLVWQDFMHAPSFEIPACLYALADYIEPIHAVTNGCLVAFKVKRNWSPTEVSPIALAFDRWSAGHAREVWNYWSPIIPQTNRASFNAGLAFLLHDLGKVDEASKVIAGLLHDERLLLGMNRWKKTSLANRYAALFVHLDKA